MGAHGEMVADIKFLLRLGVNTTLYEMRSETRLHGPLAVLKEAGLADADLDGLLNAREGSTYKTGYVVLSEPVDVHVAYLRAWVEEGSYGLRMVMPPDVYDYGDSRFR